MNGLLRSRGLFYSLALLSAVQYAGGASAQSNAVFVFENQTGSTAWGLDVTFDGTGGDLVVPPYTVVSICGVLPTVTILNGERAIIDWGQACVPDDSRVALVASTVNGPLSIRSCEWIGPTGGSLGPCGAGGGGYPFTVQPTSPLGSIKLLSGYFPKGGRIEYTNYQPPPPGMKCWTRDCCIPNGTWCAVQFLYCPFDDRSTRLIEEGRCFPITPLIIIGCQGPQYWTEMWTTDFPSQVDVLGPPPNVPVTTPSEEKPKWSYDFDVFYTDDGLRTLRPASDFISVFFKAWEAVQIRRPFIPDLPPPATTFEEWLRLIGPRHREIARGLDPLLAEFQEVLVHEPGSTLLALRDAVREYQMQMERLARFHSQGQAADLDTLRRFRRAIQAMSGQLMQLASVLGMDRLRNAAASLDSLDEGIAECELQVQAGLPDLASRDFYLWGMMNRFGEGQRHVASGMLPHARVQVDLGDYVWFGSTNPGAVVTVQDALTMEILSTIHVPLSDDQTFDLPLFGDPGPLNIQLRLPAHLSRVLRVNDPKDGIVLDAGTLVQGDVNGDNVVDSRDIMQIEADLRRGGLAAPFVPSSDVNANGLVDGADLEIAEGNLGRKGEVLSQGTRPEGLESASSVVRGAGLVGGSR